MAEGIRKMCKNPIPNLLIVTNSMSKKKREQSREKSWLSMSKFLHD